MDFMASGTLISALKVMVMIFRKQNFFLLSCSSAVLRQADEHSGSWLEASLGFYGRDTNLVLVMLSQLSQPF